MIIGFVALVVVGGTALMMRGPRESSITVQDETRALTDSFTEPEEPARTDGDEFAEFAVFPTWNTLEPATLPLLLDGQADISGFVAGDPLVEVRLADDVVLARGFAHLQEGSIEGSVPFFAQLERVDDAPEYSGNAALVITKANPSGEYETSARFTTTILIDTTEGNE